jgi:hypothetical protein
MYSGGESRREDPYRTSVRAVRASRLAFFALSPAHPACEARYQHEACLDANVPVYAHQIAHHSACGFATRRAQTSTTQKNRSHQTGHFKSTSSSSPYGLRGSGWPGSTLCLGSLAFA